METNFITAVFLPLALAVIMFGLGMTLTLTDFKRVALQPTAAFVGLGNQLILLPLLAFGLALLLPMSPELAVGLMILAVCPGGPTSNFITFLCRGDVSLSVSLTAVSSVVTVLTIPWIINLALSHFMSATEVVPLPVLNSMVTLLLITLVPVMLGMLVNHFAPGFSLKSRRWVSLGSALLFLLVLAGAIASQWKALPDFFRQAGLATLLLNVGSMTVGYLTARLFHLNAQRQLTIAIESGLQNGTLAIAIAASPLLLNNPAMAIPGAIYSLTMFVTAGLLILTTRINQNAK